MIHSRLQARRVLFALICSELLLVLIYWIDVLIEDPANRLNNLFDLDLEANLPTWFSSFQLALIALSFWGLARWQRATQRPSRAFLRTCGVLFLLLSIDETALLHERITEAIGARYVDWAPIYFWTHQFDTAVCILVLIACAWIAKPHVQGLWRISRRAVLTGLAGAIVYATGAVLLETLGYLSLASASASVIYRVEVACEEFMEMIGASFILYAVLLLLCAQAERRRKTQAVSLPDVAQASKSVACLATGSEI